MNGLIVDQLNEMMKNEMTVAVVDREALRHHYRQIAARLQNGAKMAAVVKADAYGHGAPEVASVALQNGADGLIVARFSEALQLRRAGINAPILLLGSILPHQIVEAVQLGVTLSVNSFANAQLIASLSGGKGLRATVHIKIDSGMGRLGICLDSLLASDVSEAASALEEVSAIAALPHLSVEGLYTHFAASDSQDKQSAWNQFRVFRAFVDAVRSRGIPVPLCHCANSAALLEMPQTHLQLCRPGIIQYGLWPSHQVNRSLIDLHPVLSWYTTIVHIKTVPPSFAVGYGSSFRTSAVSQIATLALGYADGFSRGNSNTGEVLIRGKRCRVVGRVCMDLTMVDVTGVDCQVGDKAVVIGSPLLQKSPSSDPEPPLSAGPAPSVTAEAIADRLGTISYEVVTAIAKRVPRLYIH